MRLALFIKLLDTMMDKNALLWKSAETVAQARLALSHQSIEYTTLMNLEMFLVSRICCKKFINADQLHAV